MAFCKEDLLEWGDGDFEEEDDVAIDGRAKSLTQARDNLLQLVVVAMLFNSSVVYRIAPCYWCCLTKVQSLSLSLEYAMVAAGNI